MKLLKLNSNYQNRKLVNLLMKFVKVLNGTTSDAGDFEYKVNEVNIANNWNPTSNVERILADLIMQQKTLY